MRKTWFIDFDGTLVLQKSHLKNEDYILTGTKKFFEEIIKEDDHVIITTGRDHYHKERIAKFLEFHKLKYDQIICNLPTGPRIVINDKKTDGTLTAYSYNLTRDEGIKIEEFNFLNNFSDIEKSQYKINVSVVKQILKDINNIDSPRKHRWVIQTKNGDKDFSFFVKILDENESLKDDQFVFRSFFTMYENPEESHFDFIKTTYAIKSATQIYLVLYDHTGNELEKWSIDPKRIKLYRVDESSYLSEYICDWIVD